MKRDILATLTTTLAVIALAALSAQAQTPPVRVQGTVDSFNGQILVMKAADGQSSSITVPPDLIVMAQAHATLADIKPGVFVGSAADKGPDGKLHAEEVHIFDESMRGRGEGHRPMGPNPDRTMTNGTVTKSDPEARTMTNGTVTATAGTTLTVKYKEGEQVIDVGPNTPIIMLIPGDRSLLVPGSTAIVVVAQKDGGMVATNVIAEKAGFKPR